MTITNKIIEIVADALYVDASEVKPDSSLVSDLGAESIDFLDIMFRMEKEFGIKIPRGEVERQARGTLSDEEFAINGLITDAGLNQLRKAMPEVPAENIKKGLYVRDIASLFTPATFGRLVASQLNPSLNEPQESTIRMAQGESVAATQ